MSQTSPLSPTDRTALTRSRDRGRTDRAELWDLLDSSLVCHVALDAGGHPVVLPTAFGVDPDGPDRDGTLYLHGSVAAGWLRAGDGTRVSVAFTSLNGLVLARSGFHHSMNYRSAVVLGTVRVVRNEDERARALDLVVDQSVPGRAATLRRPTRKELAATVVWAVPLHEASVKARTGGVNDDDEDVATGAWAGHVPLRLVADEVVTDAATAQPVPDDVRRRVAGLGAASGAASDQ